MFWELLGISWDMIEPTECSLFVSSSGYGTKLLTPLFGMDMPRMSAFFKVSWQRQSTGDVTSFICWKKLWQTYRHVVISMPGWYFHLKRRGFSICFQLWSPSGVPLRQFFGFPGSHVCWHGRLSAIWLCSIINKYIYIIFPLIFPQKIESFS